MNLCSLEFFDDLVISRLFFDRLDGSKERRPVAGRSSGRPRTEGHLCKKVLEKIIILVL